MCSRNYGPTKERVKRVRKLSALVARPRVLGAVTPTRDAAAQAAKARGLDNYIKPFADANQFSGVAPATQDGRVITEMVPLGAN